MEYNFSVETQRPELVDKKEYPLFWWGKNIAAPNNVGLCKVKVEGNKLFCDAQINTGGIKHTINDTVIAEFNPNNILMEKYEYGLLFKPGNEGQDYIYGFCLWATTPHL